MTVNKNTHSIDDVDVAKNLANLRKDNHLTQE